MLPTHSVDTLLQLGFNVTTTGKYYTAVFGPVGLSSYPMTCKFHRTLSKQDVEEFCIFELQIPMPTRWQIVDLIYELNNLGNIDE